ncbi:MAG: AlkZ family DNA glycosylase [Candidatus Dormibacteraeota bacterium]|nr:AlkZ family DNA glycosylase [Candidatus Dormibacteraeota bacterium]MBO0760374.1 AlkZ family DNA glycosylase [Candidatus Dormibacteraeota bacterium]
MTTASLTWAGVHARRLERHGLITPVPAARLVDQVGGICGAHAQVMSAAELSIGVRVAGVTRARVREALWTERSLVKTYGPRGTVHLLPASDLPLWTGALAEALAPPRGDRGARLTPDQVEEVVAAVGAALEDAELTAEELDAEVVARTGPWAGDLVVPAFTGMWPRWRQLIAEAARRGALCFGPDRGRLVTYTNPRRWLPGFRPAEGKAALAEVGRRYLHAYGAATPQAFARWLGGTPGRAVELFTELGDELERVEVEGAEAWVVAGDTEAPAGPPRGVRLLPYYDVYGVGCHPRERVFPGPAAERALVRGQAGPVPVLLVDGVVAGVWHQRRFPRTLALTVEAFGELSTAQRRELDEQAQRIGAFQEAQPNLTLGAVRAGRHL